MNPRDPQPGDTRRSDPPLAATPQTIHIHNHPRRGGWWLWISLGLLLVSLLLNLAQLTPFRGYATETRAPYERYVEGPLTSSDKIAVLEIEGVIMPPYSDHTLKAIEKISQDDNVKGVVVAIDSPGGLVADSHRIYEALAELRKTKPMVVSFGRLAASGGYYTAMGAGPDSKIFAEEVTWAGSIGVIIPRYDLSELAQKIGVASDSLKTGALKDSLDPLRPLSEEERRIWEVVLSESLDMFVQVVDQGRKELSEADVRKVATGQIFTAKQAKELKLVDEFGDRKAALASLKEELKLTDPRVVRYETPASLLESLLGGQAAASRAATDPISRLLEASVPRAMYFFGWPGSAPAGGPAG